MKFRVLIFLFLSTNITFAKEVDEIYLRNTDVASLDLNTSVKKVAVAYPGREVSDVCSLDIVTDSYFRHMPISLFLDRVEILGMFHNKVRSVDASSSTVLRFQLVARSYVDGIIIRSKNGESLKDSITKSLGAGRKVVIIPRSCL